MPLYTFVMEYQGGTYVAQARASTPRAALLAWARRLDHSAVYGLGRAGRDALIEELTNDPAPATPVRGVKHVWCGSALVRNRLMLVHFVRTAE